MTDLSELRISSAQGEYPVLFFDSIASWLSVLDNNEETYLIIDNYVARLHPAILESFQENKVYLCDANESEKTLNGVSRFVDWLLENGATRSAKILAVGGGIIQDIATFTSHIYYRGIKWEFVPTTLLSQSDSCIGAKCGINIPPHKNQLGVLNSPKRVFIVREFLASLEKYDLDSGFGEIIKLSLTGKNHFYSELKSHLSSFGLDSQKTSELIRSSLNSKKIIIEEDEYEKSLRRILNYGHSFGHALEALTKNAVPHGYGVLFGIDIINYLGVLWNMTPEVLYLDIQGVIRKYFPNFEIPSTFNAEELVLQISKDKKMSSGLMNFAVLFEVGDIRIQSKKLDEVLVTQVSDYLSEKRAFSFS